MRHTTISPCHLVFMNGMKYSAASLIDSEHCVGNARMAFIQQAYSFDLSCVECVNVPFNWLKYMLFAFLPLTCFCVFILTFKLVVPSTLVQGYVLYCQLITTPIITRWALISIRDHPHFYRAIQLIASLYGIWNLDFLRPYSLGICLQTDTLTTTAMDLAVAIFPLVMEFRLPSTLQSWHLPTN